MKELSIDIETYSDVSLKECGTYMYASSPVFEILIFAWAFDDEPVKAVTNIKDVPQEVVKALTDPSVRKTAWNVPFELICISIAFKVKLDSRQWRCTMVQATMLGLPASLDAAGKVLELETTKDAAGKALINFFTKPCKPTKRNNGALRNYMSDHMEKAFDFQYYCITDVEVEREIKKRLSFFVPSEQEIEIMALDHKINTRGVQVDIELCNAAIEVDAVYKQHCLTKARKLTGIADKVSDQKIKNWIRETIGIAIASLDKKNIKKVEKLVKGTKAEPVIKLRNEMSRTSVSKYDAFTRYTSSDGRARWLLQYNGAGRTGRWGGRGPQPHNLKRNTMEQLDMARELVRSRNLEALELLFESPSEVLSQLTRTAIIASQGRELICGDYSAIEAKVTAWLAGEEWRLDAFRAGKDIYIESAARMLKVAAKTIGKKSPERQRGKVSELALGFGGGVEALKRMGALEMGIPEEELPRLLRMWRKESPKIVQYWKEMNECAIEAVQNPGITVRHKSGVSYKVHHGILWLTLPSGRSLTYWDPKLRTNKWGKPEVTYMGVDQYTKKWTRQSTYGGKLTENIVQAIARDLLAEGMLRLDAAKLDIVMHVHDEAVIDHPKESVASTVHRINKIMGSPPEWAAGLPLGAECFVTNYYKKED